MGAEQKESQPIGSCVGDLVRGFSCSKWWSKLMPMLTAHWTTTWEVGRTDGASPSRSVTSPEEKERGDPRLSTDLQTNKKINNILRQMQILFPCVSYIQHAYIGWDFFFIHRQDTWQYTIQNALRILIFFLSLVMRYQERNCICNLLNTSRNKQFTLLRIYSFG